MAEQGMTTGAAWPFPENIPADGWDGITGGSEEDQQAIEEMQLRAALDRFEIDKTFHRVFSTPDGQAVLDYLQENYIEGRRFDPMEQDPHRAAMIGFYREGQAAFYFDVKARLERAENGPPGMEDETQQTKKKKPSPRKRKA